MKAGVFVSMLSQSLGRQSLYIYGELVTRELYSSSWVEC
jgi:hypothetical protein